MRQWIKKTDRYEPALNEATSQWCLHNGTELDECRSRKPRDKGPAESLVNQTYRYYYSRICRDTFFSYDELNSRLDELNDMFNNKTRKNKTYSRGEQYEREKRSYMLPLPPKPFLVSSNFDSADFGKITISRFQKLRISRFRKTSFSET